MITLDEFGALHAPSKVDAQMTAMQLKE